MCARMRPKCVRRISLGISPGFDLYLTENAGLFLDKCELQRAFRMAVEEGMAAPGEVRPRVVGRFEIAA